MGIRGVIALLGALAIFLFGMSTMTSGLEKLTSGKLASLLEKLTDNIFKGVLLGAVVAGMVHLLRGYYRYVHRVCQRWHS